MADLVTPSDPQISPDGRWVVASAGPFAKPGDHPTAALWLADTTGTVPASQITTGLANDIRPLWSSDSTAIAFLSDRKKPEINQLQLLSLQGGEALSLTEEPGGIADFAWLPGNKHIAVLIIDAEDPETVETRKRTKDDVYVYGAFWPFARLAMLDVETGEIHRFDHGDVHFRNIAPSPDGEKLVAVVSDLPTLDSGSVTGRFCLVDVDSGHLQTICAARRQSGTPVWSRDGNTIYFVAGAGATPVSSSQLWAVAATPDAEPELLTGDLPACVTAITRGRSSDQILANVATGVESDIYCLDPDSGDFVQQSHFNGDLQGLSVSDSGEMIGVLGSTATRPFDLYAGSPDSGLQRVSDFHHSFDDIVFGHQKVMTWERNGFTLDGILIWPPGQSPDDGPLPTTVSIHGGPYGRWANAFSHSRPFGHWLAAQGYLVFQPNPRGGSGHGQRFAEAVLHTVGNEDYLDIMAGVDAIIEAGYADPDRIGCGGWSQGGFMTAWIVGHTDRFKCGVMGAGVSDWGMMIATSDIESYETEMGGGNPYASVGPHSFDAQSPISFVHHVKTPVLIIHGEEDERVPVSQAIFFHRGLVRYGVEHELVIYPREPHGLRERAHVIDWHHRVVDWYKRWLPVCEPFEA